MPAWCSNLDVCVRPSPFPVKSHPFGKGFHLRACMAQGKILFGLDPQKHNGPFRD